MSLFAGPAPAISTACVVWLSFSDNQVINKIIRIWPIAGASLLLQEKSRFFEVIFNGFAFFASLRLKRCLWMKTI